MKTFLVATRNSRCCGARVTIEAESGKENKFRCSACGLLTVPVLHGARRSTRG